MRIIIGIIVGALIIAYYPTVGFEIRKLTNTAALEVKQATDPTLMEKLEQEVLNDLRR